MELPGAPQRCSTGIPGRRHIVRFVPVARAPPARVYFELSLVTICSNKCLILTTATVWVPATLNMCNTFLFTEHMCSVSVASNHCVPHPCTADGILSVLFGLYIVRLLLCLLPVITVTSLETVFPTRLAFLKPFAAKIKDE